MLLEDWPSIVDDDGSGKKGTRGTKSLMDSIRAAIEAMIHSAANPTLAPKDIIDQVKAAAGTLADLDARISGVINPDGTANVPTTPILRNQAGSAINLCRNSTFFLWSAGIALAPDYWVVNNGTVALVGSGELNEARKVGAKAAKLTWVSGTALLSNNILDSMAYLDHLKGEKIGFGAWVQAGIAGKVQIQISDGAITTKSGFHSGNGEWEWLSGVHTMSGSSTSLNVALLNAGPGDAYISGVVVCLGDMAPGRWYPEPVLRESRLIELAGNLTVGDQKKILFFERPLRIDNLQAFALTAPVGASLNVDFEKWLGIADGWASMVTAGPIVANGDSLGAMQPSGDYSRRCLKGLFASSGVGLGLTANCYMRLNIDQVGSGTPGADLAVRVDYVRCLHPFEDQLAFDFQGF